MLCACKPQLVINRRITKGHENTHTRPLNKELLNDGIGQIVSHPDEKEIARDKPGRSLGEAIDVAAQYLTMHCAAKTCLNSRGDKGERVGGMPERLHKGTFVWFSSLRPSQAR